jgi:hypothetical protein
MNFNTLRTIYTIRFTFPVFKAFTVDIFIFIDPILRTKQLTLIVICKLSMHIHSSMHT